MEMEKLFTFLHLAERLKSIPRHCDTVAGVREVVAAHVWRATLLAFLLRDEQPDVDMDRVIELLLVHDLGEAVTGDIPAFTKTAGDERVESVALADIADMLGGTMREKVAARFAEWEAQATREARFARALDMMEAVLSHNESDLSTWLPVEYEMNQTYALDEASEFPCLAAIRSRLLSDTLKKIEEGVNKSDV